MTFLLGIVDDLASSNVRVLHHGVNRGKGAAIRTALDAATGKLVWQAREFTDPAQYASPIVFAWAAAKIFRIGVLMYGKPPNLATLIRWARTG